jgi:poly(3-hydroxybutyrate) depolymerase
LRTLIEGIARDFAVDRMRIYLIEHSNGDYLSYAMSAGDENLALKADGPVVVRESLGYSD